MSDEIHVARDALIEGRSEVATLAAEGTPDIHACMLDLCKRLTAAYRSVYRDSTKEVWTIDVKLTKEGKLPKSQRFVRIVHKISNGQTCTWGFVEISNGLVWMAATWRGPALNYPRGCVFDEESRAALAPHYFGLGDTPAYHKFG